MNRFMVVLLLALATACGAPAPNSVAPQAVASGPSPGAPAAVDLSLQVSEDPKVLAEVRRATRPRP